MKKTLEDNRTEKLCEMMKMLNPLISIIVPVYKVEKYLRRCIDSILTQTFRDFELILVDDGSLDGCPGICDEYAEKDSRIVVIHKENGGVSSARNKGLDVARGKYIMFCDSDDYVAENWCATAYAAICQYPNSLVVHNAWQESPQGENQRYIDQYELNEPEIGIISYYECFRKNLSGAVWNKIFVSDIIKSNGLRFEASRSLGEDVIFHTEYLKAVSSVVYVRKPLYHYIINPAGAVRKYYPDLIEHHIAFFAARKPFIDKMDVSVFCDTYFFYFIRMLDNTLDPRNTMSFLQKMCYNQKMMNTEEFRYCAAHASGKNDSKLFMKVVRAHNYYIYWLFQKLCAIKSRLLHR